ncbi:glutamate-1-semialdehyde 2,1-aminomutase [Arboricoccus pini]|uniref:Glutamate-1-semialdehyde 2,1-aminomutase n=1 Tax=Arboricoccus pini TaxID=1963835 RepID=A0A212Q6N1_9PROT|nr:aspartate aminotransferase family protein [Arboricoccus pini]SNB55031.1 glutamate-1-semialdehyde 2,1-aminomutase [Arboricoccus pini]
MTEWPDPESQSRKLYERGSKVFAGGITRIQPWQEPFPVYAARGEGPYVIDVDGTRRVDLLNNFASLIHGHAHPAIVEAVRDRIGLGTAFTMPTESEIQLAELLCERVSGFEWVRFSNSGSEAVMSAVKAARALTGRSKIVKMEGAYHGSYDYVEVSLDSSPTNWGNEPASVPYAKGTPKGVTDDVIVIPFNDPEAADRIIREHGPSLAAVLIDATPTYMGMTPITQPFIKAVQTATRAVGALLILDEVISFRLHEGGAQTLFGIEPDLTTLAKIIGGGFPVGAVAGRREVMKVFDHRQGRPALPWSGTFSANPVSMTAGRVSMELLTPAVFARLNALGDLARRRIDETFAAVGVEGHASGVGSMFNLHLTRQPIEDYRSAWRTPAQAKAMFALQTRLVKEGYVISTKGMGFLSTVMDEAIVEGFAQALGRALRAGALDLVA